jgi:hypothetical protein
MTMERSYERVVKARDAIMVQFRTNGLGRATIRCPICNKGELHYAIYVKGRHTRVHSKCSTPECVEWLE